ncbi:Putative alpha/beta hydrolase-1, serine aminopeptidase, S33 [Septoria linicola]|uniref:Alpha/beta hydrolase-1, serine aminopeptidase, S33 n=1 Tax=Septoria linicola TaxID=215465 RepID=A0A9Q9EGT1_9PEZI|nr:Putative alpha/beta hydrolase-1, serine aminopeptidase, S33 [Septoria linicola]
MAGRQDQHVVTYSKDSLPSGTVYHKWTIPNARGTLILQHGFGEYSCRYMDGKLPLGPRLHELGFDIWAMDLWGHGESPGTWSVVHIGKAVDDHVTLRHIAAECNLPVFLLGHSLGGLVTSVSITADGSGVQGVILSSPELTRPVPGMLRTIVGLGAAFQRQGSVPGTYNPPEGLSRVQEEVKTFKEDERNYHGGIGLLLAATALDVGTRIWSAVGNWQVPTLVIHGDADKFTKFEVSKQFFESISTTDRHFYAVEGGYHELMRDLESEKVFDLIHNWLQVKSSKQLPLSFSTTVKGKEIELEFESSGIVDA